MKFISYNVHEWLGTDNIKDSTRTLNLIKNEAPFAAALQEVSIPPAADTLAEAHSFIEEQTGMYVTLGKTMYKGDAAYGNVLLTRTPPNEVILHDISVKGAEPRGIIQVKVNDNGRELTILATHLGLKRHERIRQAETVRKIVNNIKGDIIMMCDSNEWYRGKASKILDSCLSRAVRIKTFPSKFPIFSLDHIRTRGFDLKLERLKNAETKRYSDHLPVIAETS